jgi:hypothetical protein
VLVASLHGLGYRRLIKSKIDRQREKKEKKQGGIKRVETGG